MIQLQSPITAWHVSEEVYVLYDIQMYASVNTIKSCPSRNWICSAKNVKKIFFPMTILTAHWTNEHTKVINVHELKSYLPSKLKYQHSSTETYRLLQNVPCDILCIHTHHWSIWLSIISYRLLTFLGCWKTSNSLLPVPVIHDCIASFNLSLTRW